MFRRFIHGSVAILALTGGLCSAQAAPSPRTDRIEVPVGRVFAPPQGYDDNDNIEVVIDGYLPNNCYRIDKTEILRVAENGFSVRQYAVVDREGICASSGNLPPSFSNIVPFTIEASLGQLKSGNYQVTFSRGGASAATRSFRVDRAASASVDSLPYAAVSNAYVGDIVRGDAGVQAMVSGVLTSSCSELNEEIIVRRIDDVVMVLPTVKTKPGMMCQFMLRPFERMVDLGKLEEGRYLVHVRSMNGKAVNRTFSAVIPDPQ